MLIPPVGVAEEEYSLWAVQKRELRKELTKMKVETMKIPHSTPQEREKVVECKKRSSYRVRKKVSIPGR